MEACKAQHRKALWNGTTGERSGELADWALRGVIFLGLGYLVYLNLSRDSFEPLLRAMDRHGWSRVVARPSILWALMGTLMLGFRTILWLRYRPHEPATPEDAPALTVIIPAYNEGAMVAKSIDSVAAAAYPRERLEILVVDDGSTDDTWTHIERAAGRYAEIVTTIRFPRNRGKRAALSEGIRRARGEVVVTIDSDSVIEKGTLLSIAGPFRRANVGAVAGKVLVYNRRAGLIPRMLHVRFVLSFDFLRSVQSTYGTVYCCPGALSAYRTSVLREVLPEWETQTFLGAECTYGEDRALTNYILSLGYDALYQSTAVVHTVVPVTYTKLCKMYLRWDRSYIREEIRFAGSVVWKRRPVARLIAAMDSLITNLRYPVSFTALPLLLLFSIEDPMAVLRLMMVMGAMAGLNMLYYLRSELSWDFVFGIFYAYFSFFTLFWVFPYAAATLRARSWLTR
ncbi:MAG: glycosyltransferase family 2 protein [Verrucomicrobiota bacterium]